MFVQCGKYLVNLDTVSKIYECKDKPCIIFYLAQKDLAYEITFLKQSDVELAVSKIIAGLRIREPIITLSNVKTCEVQ